MQTTLEKLQQELVIDEILSIIRSKSTVWECRSIPINNTSYDGDITYILTPYKGGFILLQGGEVYCSTNKSDYTWCSLVDYSTIFLGMFEVSCETYSRVIS